MAITITDLGNGAYRIRRSSRDTAFGTTIQYPASALLATVNEQLSVTVRDIKERARVLAVLAEPRATREAAAKALRITYKEL